MSLQTQDIIRRSATNALTPAPRVRDYQQEVAKLIDVTTASAVKLAKLHVVNGMIYVQKSGIRLVSTITQQT